MSARLPAQSVRQQLDKILVSSQFAHSERMQRFLRFVTEQTLAGRSGELKEYVLGVEVFDRSASYDPRSEPIVRVEARRLRAKLKAYYEAEGKGDDIVIELPTGTYAPRVEWRAGTAIAAAVVAMPAPARRNTIAVLPLLNLSGDPDNQYLSDGLTEELIHRLTQVVGLQVVAWQSASHLREHQEDLARVREQLHASYILRGSVRRSGERLRVMAQLVDTQDGRYLWSETYGRTVKDALAIEQEIASAIVQTLQQTLGLTCDDQRGVARGSTAQSAAYLAYLQGRFHWNKRTGEGLQQGIRCFQEALSADASFALAYAGLADSYSLLGDYGLVSPEACIPLAREAAEKALALDPTLGEAYTSLAIIYAMYDWQWAKSEECYLRAIALNPGYAQVRHWYATDYLAVMGRIEEAKQEMAVARRLDPLSAIIAEGQAFPYLLERRYEEAITCYRELMEIYPYFYKAYTGMGRAYAQLGKYDEAIAYLEKGRGLAAGNVPSILAALGQVQGLAGRPVEARGILRELQQLAETRYVPATSFAIVHLGLGEYDRALDWLETAAERRDLPLLVLNVHPLYDPLRAEPRFTALLRRMGFLP